MCYNILPSWVFVTFKLNLARNLILVFEPICLRSNCTASALLCSPFESLLDIHCIEFFVPYEKESYHSLLFMNVEWKCCLLERDGLEGIALHRLDMNARYCMFITAVKQLCGTTLLSFFGISLNLHSLNTSKKNNNYFRDKLPKVCRFFVGM